MNIRINYLILLLLLSVISMMSCEEGTTPAEKDARSQEMTPVEQLTSQIKNDPENAELYFQRAKLYAEAGSANFAVRDIEKAITIDDTQYEYHHLLADIYMDSNESRKALNFMTKAGEKFPDNELTQLKLAEFQLITMRYIEALSTINTYINSHPGSAESFYMKGAIYSDMGDKVNAAKNLRRATELDAQHVDAWIMLGDLLTEENNPIAITMYENALRTDPRNNSAMLGIPLFYHKTGQLEEAISEYKKIIEVQPSEFPSHYNLGLVYLELDSLEKAYETFDVAIKAGPSYANGYYYKGFAAQLLGNLDEARELYEQSLRLAPDYAEAQTALDELNNEQ